VAACLEGKKRIVPVINIKNLNFAKACHHINSLETNVLSHHHEHDAHKVVDASQSYEY
jgi:hypothetical protein